MRKSYVKTLPIEKIKQMYFDQKLSSIEVGKAMGVSGRTIRRTLKYYGLGLTKTSKAMMGSNNSNWKGYKDLGGRYISKLKYSAKLRDYEWDIDIKYVWDLWIQQNKRCALTGIDLILPTKSIDMDTGNVTASLDRIDNDKGYIKNNVQWVHKRINLMKHSMSQKELLYWCELVTKGQK